MSKSKLTKLRGLIVNIHNFLIILAQCSATGKMSAKYQTLSNSVQGKKKLRDYPYVNNANLLVLELLPLLRCQ